MSSIKSEKIQQFELGPFWEGHREMLGKLVETDMPSKSRMHYTEVVADRHPETNNLLIKYGKRIRFILEPIFKKPFMHNRRINPN